MCKLKRYASIPIPVEIHQQIQEKAIKKGLYVSISDFVREAIRIRLTEIESVKSQSS